MPPTPPSLSLSRPTHSIKLLLTSHQYFNFVATALLVWESLLCIAIIYFVPYTEIDWSTYMQQVTIFLSGERNYSLLEGDTGPIVYPAGFLYLYTVLYYITDKGKDIRFAQYIFAQIYVVTLALVFVLYKRCGSVPPYALIFLTLSKRLHSIFVLRLFNDGVAMMFFYAAILFWTNPKPRWSIGSIFFSLALSIKMNFLLYIPSLLYLFFTLIGPLHLLLQFSLVLLVQLVLSFPFSLSNSSNAKTYFLTSFNFSREFMWEWTVNWRWIGEDGFGSEEFKLGLLALNLGALVLFGVEWARRDGGGVGKLVWKGLGNPLQGSLLSGGVGSVDRFVTILFTSNLVGILFARSLHYQFYAWYFHQIIFLLLHTPFDLIQRILIVGAIEYGWNTFPSTLRSSMGLCFANAFILLGVFYGDPTGLPTPLLSDEREGDKTKVE